MSKTLAALLAAPALAFAIGAALIAALPTSREAAFALGSQLMIPLWVTLACIIPLARRGSRVWLLSAGVASVALLFAWRGGS